MREYMLLALRSLSHRKTRTGLTLLGIIIGITAVVAMVSIGSGMQAALVEELKVLGTDKIIIQPLYVSSGATAKGLTERDSRAVEGVLGVGFVSPLYSVASNVKFKGEEETISLWGLPPEKAERTFSGTSGYKLYQGRWLRKGDRGKVAIGYGVHDDFFERKVTVGNTLLIKGMNFDVIGIFRKTGDRDSDYAVYADIDQVRELYGKKEAVTLIVVRVKEGFDVEQVGKRIEDTLKKRRKEKDFTVLTPAQLAERVGQVYKIIQVVFGGIAAISLLVGALGIANTMVMNVLERTREVGIMKALGATDGHVMKLFLLESGVIGVVGGAAGVLIGFIISRIINLASARFLGEGILTTHVSSQLALFALAFSFLIGIISGLYPAYRASKMDPVIALRG
jgi:putative ABC transport system permease protein